MFDNIRGRVKCEIKTRKLVSVYKQPPTMDTDYNASYFEKSVINKKNTVD